MKNNVQKIQIRNGNKIVEVPVEQSIYSNFHNQFSRKNPGELFQKRYKTLTKLMLAAYLHGLAEGKGGIGGDKK
jgi:hypothetical protein